MKLIAKKDIAQVLSSWSSSYSILSPSLKEQGDCVFDTFDPKTFTLEYRKPPMPMKSSFLPQSETIFTVEGGNFTPVLANKRVLLFGIRACDMMGILQSRSFFSRDLNDDYFKAHTDHTVIVVHACSWPQNETCFCTTTHSGPYAKQGFDIQLFDIGNDFLVEAGSETGKALISSKPFVDFDGPDDEERLHRVKHMAHNSIPLVPEVHEAMDLMKGALRMRGYGRNWEGSALPAADACTCAPHAPASMSWTVRRTQKPGRGYAPGIPVFMADSPARHPAIIPGRPRRCGSRGDTSISSFIITKPTIRKHCADVWAAVAVPITALSTSAPLR